MVTDEYWLYCNLTGYNSRSTVYHKSTYFFVQVSIVLASDVVKTQNNFMMFLLFLDTSIPYIQFVNMNQAQKNVYVLHMKKVGLRISQYRLSNLVSKVIKTCQG